MTLNTPPENSFKDILKALLLLTIVSLLLLFTSCKSTIPTVTKTFEKVVEQHKDSTKITEINKAISDSLIIKVAKVATAKPECDSITQATLDQVLRQLNSRKKSGDNEAGVYYDEVRKMIIAYLKQAETKSEKATTNKEKTDTTKGKEIVEVPVKYIPWWVKTLAWIGAVTVVYVGFRVSRIFWA